MRLNVFSVGGGPKGTVLLHGFLGSGKNLRTLAQRWSEKDPSRTFLLQDLTGHGESPPPPEGYTLHDVAEDVLETVDACGLGAVELVGHSLGGRVALHALDAQPHRVTAVTLLDITPGPIPEGMSESGSVLQVLLRAPDEAPDRATLKKFFLGEGLPAHLADWLLMNLLPSASGGVTWRFDREALGRLHTRVNGEDLWPLAERHAKKLSAVRGTRSAYLSEADLSRLSALGVPVAEVPSGHFVHVEALEPLLAFLTR